MKSDLQVEPLASARLLQLMEALERAGGTPVETYDLHAFAYLSNVLSPLWDLQPIEYSVLKDRTKDGPYYPLLQRQIERCVGSGLIEVVDLQLPHNSKELQARFRLANKRAASLLAVINDLPDETGARDFLFELASAFLEIRGDKRDDAAALDAAFSDPAVPSDRIVAFGPRAGHINASLNTADALQDYAPPGVTLSAAEKLVLYVRLLKRRANG